MLVGPVLDRRAQLGAQLREQVAAAAIGEIEEVLLLAKGVHGGIGGLRHGSPFAGDAQRPRAAARWAEVPTPGAARVFPPQAARGARFET
ncbi:hypothetical protein GCM10027067_40030 [Pseudactinotalea suaedae]